MILLAIIHLALMLLLPIAIFVIFRFARPIRLKACAGLALILLCIMTYAFCIVFWPFDFIFPRDVRSPSILVGQFRVNTLQRPGKTFYETYIEVRRPDGKVGTRLNDRSDGKMWRGRFEQSYDHIALKRWFSSIGYYDPSMTYDVLWTRAGEYEKLSDLDFQ